MDNKRVHVIGGSTLFHVRTHLALCSGDVVGTTAKEIAALCREQESDMEVHLHLTKMADPNSKLVTNEDLMRLARTLVEDPRTKIVFFCPAVCDEGVIDDVPSGKYATRLKSHDENEMPLEYTMRVTPAPKIIDIFRSGLGDVKPRKDILLIGFKTTADVTVQEQYVSGLHLLKRSSCNLVLANDVVTRKNMVVVPEEATYHATTNRAEALKGLVEMTYLRSHLTFTHSTVRDGKPVPWESELVYPTLRAVVDYCIARGAYKKFRGVTAGHFAVKINDTTFLSSRRKTDFNDMKNVGLVKVETDGPDSVIAYGSKPSVGGQSQRIVFAEHPDADCVVHFHCPIKDGSLVSIVSQREFECGSHECGQNTSRGLKQFGSLHAVYLDQHGPNIVFNHSVDPGEVIAFIENNFDLDQKTGGYVGA